MGNLLPTVSDGKKGWSDVNTPDIIQLLKNVGMDTDCGACMEIAFTGITTADHTCAPFVDGRMYLIENTQHRGDCCVWWRPKGHGYTRVLDEAGRWPKEEAERICRSRPEQDKMWLVADAVEQAVRHVPR